MPRWLGRTTSRALRVDVVGGVEVAIFEAQRCPLPLPVVPDDPVGASVGEGLHAHLRVGGLRGLLQNRLHRRVGCERSALLDTEGGEVTVVGAVALVRRFRVDGLVQHLPEHEVGFPLQRCRVLSLAGHVQPLRFCPVVGRVERIDLDGGEPLVGRRDVTFDGSERAPMICRLLLARCT
jgi:hypothetical protein